MATQQPTPVPMLGFMVFEKTGDGDGFVSAMMVTDSRGYPLEFRATTPVKPTLVQRTLYGSQIQHYVAIELCGAELIRKSQRKPRLTLVPEPWLLDIAGKTGTNMMALWRAGESLRVEAQASSDDRGTLQTDPGASALIYEKRFQTESDEGEMLRLVATCAKGFHLLEAFGRMRAAIELLAKEDKRYQ